MINKDTANALDKVSIEFHKLLNLQLLAVDSYNRGFLSRSLLASLLECSLIDLNAVIDEKRALWPIIAEQEIKYKLKMASIDSVGGDVDGPNND